jgi:glycosyltransferase involved in cell wall biosynthesis
VPDDPVVSVVLPVHNTRPEFLREAIESVRCQAEQRWELVISLDAASAACASVAGEFAALDPQRIVVVGESGGQPRGVSAARNMGVARARATMIGFLDADDVLEPRALAERRRLLEANPEVAMVYGSTLYWHSWNGNSSNQRRDHVPELGVPVGVVMASVQIVSRFIEGSATVPCTCSILVRRSAIDASGGFDDSFPGLYEDQTLYARLGLRFPMLAGDQVLDRYRQHEESMTAAASRSRENATRARFLAWLENEMSAAGVADGALTATIARERRRLEYPRLARIIRLVRRAARRLVARSGQG